MSRRLTLPLLFLLAGCTDPGLQWHGTADARSEVLCTPNTCVTVTSVTLEHVERRGWFETYKRKDPSLVIGIRIDNTGAGKIVRYRRDVTLTDPFGNKYAEDSYQLANQGRSSAELRRGESVEDVLTFLCPVDEAESVDLEFSCNALGGEGRFAFRIPRSMWQKEN